MSSDVAIRVENLSKRYQVFRKPSDRLKQMAAFGRSRAGTEFWALQNVSFELKRGESLGIVGRNGSGKSTLLQLICGTLAPTSGTVETNGRVAALLELGSGFNPEFSGRENVFMNAAISGLSNEQVKDSFDDIVAFADIGAFIDQAVKTYSSGMVVRLAFAVQSALEPEILIVDEALAVGDEKFQRKCFARLDDLKSKGTSILFVSHSGPQVVELCDRALLLDDGRRITCGPPAGVIRMYQRLIYAPDTDRAGLIAAFSQDDAVGGHEAMNEYPVTATSEIRVSETSSDYFDDGLIPASTVAYPVRGAEITDFEIVGEDGRRVNVLSPLKNYRVVMSGRFIESFSGIYFGIHIRSITGAVISGQRHPEEGKFITTATAGSRFSVEFGFNMALLPDSYFIGGGVWSATEPSCAHRILDALMFRVQSTGPRNAFGYCNLMTQEPHFVKI
jgi:lipopolysaccharide transport system ATP-binding protein